MDFLSTMAGNVAVVVGAGISKDAPASLPSWWEYNFILLEMIGRIGAEALGNNGNLLNLEQLEERVPVASVSEFFESRIAGRSYFPLISMLDGAKPNIHHLMLAELAKDGVISAIITTNFDTLIERAFAEKHIEYNAIDVPSDYYTKKREGFPIYKIHGSADNSEYAIDTVKQKLGGLSIEKRKTMEGIIESNHILFMGFSGEDFLFGTDYIPIQKNKLGITWVAHPGSRFNEVTEKVLRETKATVLHSTLNDFYTNNGWQIPAMNINVEDSEEGLFRKKAETMVRELLEQPHIGKVACLGMCIELLMHVGDKDAAERIVKQTEVLISNKELNLIEGVQHYLLFESLRGYYFEKGNLSKARFYSRYACQVLEKVDQILEDSENNSESNTERFTNKSSTFNNIGLIELYDKNYSEALVFFSQALYMAYKAMNWNNMAIALYNIGRSFLYCKEFEEVIILKEKYNGISIDRIMGYYECARAIAKHGGDAQIQFEIACELVGIYGAFNQKELMGEAYSEAERLQNLCLNSELSKQILVQKKDIIDTYQEKAAKYRSHYPLNESSMKEDFWTQFTNRPILACDEGRKVKRLFDSGNIKECISYLLESIRIAENDERYTDAEMLLALYIDMLFWNIAESRMDTRERLERLALCYEKIILLQISTLRIDYFIESLCRLSHINFLLGEKCNRMNFACYQAELAICLSSCFLVDINILEAMEVASKIYFLKRRFIPALAYCKMFLNNVEQSFPDLVDSLIYSDIKKLYENILESE